MIKTMDLELYSNGGGGISKEKYPTRGTPSKR